MQTQTRVTSNLIYIVYQCLFFEWLIKIVVVVVNVTHGYPVPIHIPIPVLSYATNDEDVARFRNALFDMTFFVTIINSDFHYTRDRCHGHGPHRRRLDHYNQQESLANAKVSAPERRNAQQYN